MNTVRKLLELNLEEVKRVLEKAYFAIEVFQGNRNDIKLEQGMYHAIVEATEFLKMFKPYIPAYKQKYFDIIDHHSDLNLSSRDLLMTFDRMVFELHTRLEKKISDSYDLQAWSPLMKEVLDGRRKIPQNNKNKSNEPDLEFIASGLSVVSGYVDSYVQIISGKKDYEKTQPGDILISKMTTPDMIVVVDKIAGIVTEQGGQFCHAAIIAREYNIPCVVGCGDFIHNIRDREILILDATTGILYR